MKDERTIKRIPAAELMPLYISEMREKGSVTIPVSGGSMSPFLTHLRDSVTLSPIKNRRIRRGDIALYNRNGEGGIPKYVMHRVVGIRKDGLVFCGDGQTEREYGIGREKLIAVATGAKRKGRVLTEKSAAWLFFKHIWRVLRPIRPFLIKLHGRLKGS